MEVSAAPRWPARKRAEDGFDALVCCLEMVRWQAEFAGLRATQDKTLRGLRALPGDPACEAEASLALVDLEAMDSTAKQQPIPFRRTDSRRFSAVF